MGGSMAELRPAFETPDGRVAVYCGDALEVLAALPEESVDCCVTSPPYWSLRKYDAAPSVWGGDPNCPHTLEAQPVGGESYGGKARWQHEGVSRQETPEAWIKGEMPGASGGRGYKQDTNPGAWFDASQYATCRLCGAWRGQYGLEPIPDSGAWMRGFLTGEPIQPCNACYVCHTLTVLRAIRRVLKATGTVWWNIGDGYTSMNRSGRKESPKAGKRQAIDPIAIKVNWNPARHNNFSWTLPGGWKPKDLVLMPMHIALALRTDGWWVRSVIVWHKPNAMPESVTDRPTDAHEYILLLTKSERYWSDFDAVREAATGGEPWGSRVSHWDGQGPHGGTSLIEPLAHEERVARQDGGRNCRSVWTFPTAQYPGAHFAVFPKELPERCIKAGCPPDGTLLDPFAGTGTALAVAYHLGRRAIGIEISQAYFRMAQERLRQGVLPLEVS